MLAMSELRYYGLVFEEHEVQDDKSFALVFNDAGEMYVRVRYSSNKDYGSKSSEERIFPKDFAKHTADGNSLLKLVVTKLGEILPKSK
jgi:hypothetical protein